MVRRCRAANRGYLRAMLGVALVSVGQVRDGEADDDERQGDREHIAHHPQRLRLPRFGFVEARALARSRVMVGAILGGTIVRHFESPPTIPDSTDGLYRGSPRGSAGFWG